MATGPLTTSQVARMAGCSINTVLRAAHAGELKGQQIGEGPNASFIYNADDVDGWIASRAAEKDSA